MLSRPASAARQASSRPLAGVAGETTGLNMSHSLVRSRFSVATRLARSFSEPWIGCQSSCQPASRAIRNQKARCVRPLPSRKGCK